MDLLLRNLSPRFIKCEIGIADEAIGRPGPDGQIEWGGFPVDLLTTVQTLADADGIQFLCPHCYAWNRGPIGTHRIMVYFRDRGAPPHIGVDSQGQTVRWDVMGNDFLDLTLNPSIELRAGCKWHGSIQHGVARYA